MNLLDNSGAEAATTPPTTSGGVTRTTFTANSGSYSWALTGSNSAIGGFVPASITWTGIGLTIGTSYEVECYVNGSLAVGVTTLSMDVDKGDGSFVPVRRILPSEATGSWQRLDGGSFVALGSTARFRVVVTAPVSFGTTTWYVDDCRLAEDGDVAIRLSERAVDNVVSLLQTNLPTDLADVVTERGDSLAITAPPNAAYYKRPRPEIAGGTCHVEVFEESSEFVNPYTDRDAQRVASQYPLIVRVTYFRRNGETADQMTTIRRRLLAAVVISLLTNTTYDDNEVQNISVTGDDFSENYAEDGTLAKVQVTLSITVQQEESYA